MNMHKLKAPTSDGPAEEAGFPHALGHALAEHPVDDARVLVAAEVPRRGRAVAYALDDRLVPGARPACAP